MNNRLTNILATILLLTLFWTAFSSMAKDALTFDELAHIPAGYSYLSQKDYRVNPEHPPLLKDLSAIPLLFVNLNFPTEDEVWLQKDSAPAWWVQFDLGTKFLYQSGNSPKTIIVLSRLPMILLLLFLGWFLFKWARELGGNYAGLAVLALFSFSPNFIAHGRLVTTDVGAALGAVLASYFWLKFLKNPSKSNIFFAGIFFGIAMAIKFSLVLLIPFLGIITIVYALVSEEKLKNLKKYVFKAVLAGIIGLIFVVWPIYQFHVWNYPADHQVRDTMADLAPNQITPAKNLVIWMADKPILRPFSQFFRGVLMASQRTMFGNTVYFMGNISASGWWYYFPFIYFFKIPLAFHIITIITLLTALILRIRRIWLFSIKKHFALFAFAVFLLIYWLTAMAGNLNIGVRHLLPTFPFIYLIIAGLCKEILSNTRLKRISIFLILPLFGWYILSSLLAFPHYLPYFNEAAGGTENGYKYAVDSNYDWGQDFYRLLNFVEENNIDKIHLDYFGGENPEYWLGEKYVRLSPREIKEPPTGWVAVSLNQLMGGVAKPVPGFDQQTDYYQWLKKYDLAAKAGHSIFIYDAR